VVESEVSRGSYVCAVSPFASRQKSRSPAADEIFQSRFALQERIFQPQAMKRPAPIDQRFATMEQHSIDFGNENLVVASLEILF
jgi:hypothetical protein